MLYRTISVILIGLMLSGLTLAQDGAPPMPEIDGEIVLQGLNGPQGLHVDADGTLWVVDSGLGGEEEIDYFNPTTMEATVGMAGQSSRVINLLADGTQEDVAALSSIVAGEDVVGGARVTTIDGTAYITVGGWQEVLGEEVSIPLYSQVVSLSDGELASVADTWAFERDNNPDETGNLESHPFGIEAGPDGMLYMADAAANVVLRIDPASGETELVAVFDAMQGVFPNPFRGGEMLTDPVPTGVTFDADGELYVSLLSGAPFIPGSAKVVHIAEDGTVSDYALGLTMLTDVTTGPDGNLYATQFGMFTQEGPVFNSGSVVRILADGTSEVVVDGLPFVTAIAFNDAGDAYVAINGVPIPGAGMVVLYENMVEMAGEPIMMPE